jgi:uncharacterized protein (TIGR02058 family)
MSPTPLILELGTGSSLRSGSYTKAACRAVRDALWRNSINLAELFDGQKSDMIIDLEIACQRPEKVDVSEVINAFPYGQISTKSVLGGLDIQHPANSQCPPTIIAHAAIIVSLNLATKGG